MADAPEFLNPLLYNMDYCLKIDMWKYYWFNQYPMSIKVS